MRRSEAVGLCISLLLPCGALWIEPKPAVELYLWFLAATILLKVKFWEDGLQSIGLSRVRFSDVLLGFSLLAVCLLRHYRRTHFSMRWAFHPKLLQRPVSNVARGDFSYI